MAWSAAAVAASVWQASLPGDKAGSRPSPRPRRTMAAAVPQVPESDFSFQRSSTFGQIPGGKTKDGIIARAKIWRIKANNLRGVMNTLRNLGFQLRDNSSHWPA